MKNFIIIIFIFIIITLLYLNYKNINIIDKNLGTNIKNQLMQDKVNTGNTFKNEQNSNSVLFKSRSVKSENIQNQLIDNKTKSKSEIDIDSSGDATIDELPDEFSDL